MYVESDDPLDPRVSELVGFADAARITSLSYWTLYNARRSGRLRGVTVPGGAVGLLTAEVLDFAREHRARLRARREAKARTDAAADAV